MTTDIMSHERFSDLLDSLGASLKSWPTTEREAAERLLASSPRAVERLNEALALDQSLRAEQPRAPAGLIDRIMRASGAADPSDEE